MNVNKWDLNTRFLHMGLAATVTAQLFISLIMVAPDHHGSTIGKLAFEAHEMIGLAALGIVLMHWVWSILSSANGSLQNLFPINKTARQIVIDDYKAIKHGDFPVPNKKGGIAGLIHGLGLLAVTGIAITGGALFLLFPDSGEPGALAEGFAGLHEGIAVLVWAYWIGHGGMAIAHQLKGRKVISNMFSFGSKEHLKTNIAITAANKRGLHQH